MEHESVDKEEQRRRGAEEQRSRTEAEQKRSRGEIRLNKDQRSL
jgi:hypothetical protein